MSNREVMQQALEALEAVCLSLQLPDLLKVVGPITALHAALEQPEQVWIGCGECDCAFSCFGGAVKCIRLPVQEPTCPKCKAGVLYECVACSSNNYPSKAQRKPLTASEILNMMPGSIPAEHDGALMEFARAIEAKLKERNNE